MKCRGAKILALILVLALPSLAACSNGTTPSRSAPEPSSISEPAPLSSSASASKPGGVAGTGKVTYAEDEMPVNSSENQAYAEQYIYPFAVTGLFRYSFSPGHMDALLVTEPAPPVKSIFNAFYNYDYSDSDLQLTDRETDVPQKIFERTLMDHLDVTAEQIRQSCAQFYNQEKKVYTAAFGLGGGPAKFIITESSLEGNQLHLVYDVYTPDYDQNMASDDYCWALYQQGVLEMEINGNSYKYISNVVQDVPGID